MEFKESIICALNDDGHNLNDYNGVGMIDLWSGNPYKDLIIKLATEN